MQDGRELPQNKYFYGIDLLRVIAIVNVVILHTLRRSGLIYSSTASQYNTAWLLETIAFFAVDTFGIIAGFVNYSDREKPTKFSRIALLWIQVVFYGFFAIAIIRLFTDVQIGASDIATAALPLLRGEYWFFSAYVGMMLFSNLINTAVRNMSNKALYLTLIMLLAGSIIELFSVKSKATNLMLSLENGYSCLWLIMMYIVGAAMRKTGFYRLIKKREMHALIAIIVLIAISWGWLVAVHNNRLLANHNDSGWERLFVEYISPTIICISVLLVALFANLSFGRRWEKIIRLIAPTAFSIYLLNSQPLIAKHVYNKEHLSFLMKSNYFKLIFEVIGVSIAFSFVAIIVDKLRNLIFKTMKINQLVSKVDTINDKG